MLMVGTTVSNLLCRHHGWEQHIDYQVQGYLNVDQLQQSLGLVSEVLPILKILTNQKIVTITSHFHYCYYEKYLSL